MRGAPSIVLWCAAGVLSCAFATGCGSSHRDAPYTRTLEPAGDEALARGQVAFMQNCHQCHPNGAGGVAPAINDKPLPEGLIKLQIRQGLGNMPAFNEQHLSDADVNAIVRYLKALRDLDRHPPPPRAGISGA